MNVPPPAATAILLQLDPKLNFSDTGTKLPIAHLESLRFKCNQIIESIVTLQRTIEYFGVAAMPAWPDILSKYNVLLSQTHSFSNSLLPILNAGKSDAPTATTAVNPYEKIALHPSAGVSDAILDNELIPLLRNQQTTDVLRMENETVRRLAEKMKTKGSIGVLSTRPLPGMPHKPEYTDVIAECAQIRSDHDARVERAVRAVGMLREKFEWKARVEVEVEEPEELTWDPRLAPHAEDVDVDNSDGSSDEEEVESALNDQTFSAAGTPTMLASPAAATPDAMTPNAMNQLVAELEDQVATS